jgi:hypothetical protein
VNFNVLKYVPVAGNCEDKKQEVYEKIKKKL